MLVLLVAWTDGIISGLQCQCLQTRFTLQMRVQVYHGRANKVCSIAWWAAPENWGWGVTVAGQVLGSPTYQRCHIVIDMYICHISNVKCQYVYYMYTVRLSIFKFEPLSSWDLLVIRMADISIKSSNCPSYLQPVRGEQGGQEQVFANKCSFDIQRCRTNRNRNGWGRLLWII